jgi:hypothetical protein
MLCNPTCEYHSSAFIEMQILQSCGHSKADSSERIVEPSSSWLSPRQLRSDVGQSVDLVELVDQTHAISRQLSTRVSGVS